MLVVTTAVYVLVGSMHVGGALANVIVRAELPSAAGQGVSPVRVAPTIVLGGGSVVAVLRSSVADEPAIVVVLAAVAVPLLLLPPLTRKAMPVMATATSGINRRYMPVRLRLPARACRASSSNRC